MFAQAEKCFIEAIVHSVVCKSLLGVPIQLYSEVHLCIPSAYLVDLTHAMMSLHCSVLFRWYVNGISLSPCCVPWPQDQFCKLFLPLRQPSAVIVLFKEQVIYALSSKATATQEWGRLHNKDSRTPNVNYQLMCWLWASLAPFTIGIKSIHLVVHGIKMGLIGIYWNWSTQNPL